MVCDGYHYKFLRPQNKNVSNIVHIEYNITFTIILIQEKQLPTYNVHNHHQNHHSYCPYHWTFLEVICAPEGQDFIHLQSPHCPALCLSLHFAHWIMSVNNQLITFTLIILNPDQSIPVDVIHKGQEYLAQSCWKINRKTEPQITDITSCS